MRKNPDASAAFAIVPKGAQPAAAGAREGEICK